MTSRLLAALPRGDAERLRPHLEHSPLVGGDVLCEMGAPIPYAYFPVTGVVSLLLGTRDGASLALALVGADGVVGLSTVIEGATAPYRTVVEMPGDALRLPAAVLRDEFLRHGTLRDALLRLWHAEVCEIAQSAVCHAFHAVPQRLCRCLLMARDRACSDVLTITQAGLALLVGSTRTTVTEAAVDLQDAGFIRYRHGHIQIVNPAGLAASACECYRLGRAAPSLRPAR